MIRTALALSLPVVCWCLACAATIVPFSGASDPAAEATLKQLNQQYVDSFLHSDVQWYQQHLTEDFVCIESDGTILDKASFLRDTAKGPGVADYRLVEVQVRVIGDTALIHAQGQTTRHDGSTSLSRYTDVYVRVQGEWKAASAQITGIRPMKSTS
jgi:ketosteroid isomerase-like protein